ncbi:DNA cross-link repair 1A protein [Frankliniella fusca]|uniref:DNA cross-link repair 1A protein n=1 Tax=Frankliniella fusca TaxID=407009 RepID=A0AAE1I1H9_9NEOP|nr:DNA cross-link repair 1A protein [Frankliniella fusca]
MGKKKDPEHSENSNDDSEDDVFKPKRPIRSQKTKTIINVTSPKSQSQKKSNRNKRSSKVSSPAKKSQRNTKRDEKQEIVQPSEEEGKKEKDDAASNHHEFCPICQVPLSILKITPANHTATCNVPANLPACPAGSNCLNANIFHYRDFSHHVLAAFRDSEDYVEPDVVFTPQKAKLKRTPLKTSGTKRPSKSPVASVSKIRKKVEASCSPSISLESPSLPSQSACAEESKKRLSFNKDPDESDPDDPENSEILHQTDVMFSDLILNEDPEEHFSHEPIPIKNEPWTPNYTDETGISPFAAANAKVSIDYLSDLPSNCDQDIIGHKMACNEKCQKIFESVETLEANCSVIFKANGVNRREAMAKSPVSINLFLDNSGWEAVEVKSSNLQKLKISLCECSDTICVDCSLSAGGGTDDVDFIPNNDPQPGNFFVSMVDMGLKPPNGHPSTKEYCEASCNQIKVASFARNTFISEESNEDLVRKEVPSDNHDVEVGKASTSTRPVVDAFSLLKKTAASSSSRKSATVTTPLTGSNSRPSTPIGVPLVVSKTTGSSWTLVPSKENKTKSGWAQPSGNKKVPHYKRIPDTPFVVDAFSYGIIPGIKIYFLSHFHSDHYIGLKKDFNMPIFCSQVTANLVHLKIRVDKKYLHVLKMNEPRVVCGVEIEIFDANHCPGAIMFLFRLLDGRVFLHVGDFRAHTSMEEFPQLQQVDKLYLDTTYCDPSYNFPSQEEVVNKVIRTVEEHLSGNRSTLIVCGTYTIGKEKVFMGVANNFNMKIWTNSEKRRVLLCLEDQNIIDRLTNDPLEAQIHVLAMRDISFEVLPSYLSKYSSKYSKILGFKPTGWTTSTSLKGKPSDFQRDVRGKVTIYGVPYSEHSSFSELRQFVRFVNPKDIQVTVNVNKSAQYKKLFQQWLSNSRDFDSQSKMIQYFSSSK